MQNKILELMPADPQAAMALAVEHYTGLKIGRAHV